MTPPGSLSGAATRLVRFGVVLVTVGGCDAEGLEEVGADESRVFELHDASIDCLDALSGTEVQYLDAIVYVKSEDGPDDIDGVVLLTTDNVGRDTSGQELEMEFQGSTDLLARIRTTRWAASLRWDSGYRCAPLGEHYVILATDIHGTEVRVDVPPIRVEL